LNESVYNQYLDYKCVSFDYCTDPKGGFICSLYNYSTTTDKDVVLESAPECDHYSSKIRLFFYCFRKTIHEIYINNKILNYSQETSNTYDSADVTSLFRVLEEAVIRKKFNLNIKDEKGNVVVKK
jgi:hypothetical protein